MLAVCSFLTADDFFALTEALNVSQVAFIVSGLLLQGVAERAARTGCQSSCFVCVWPYFKCKFEVYSRRCACCVPWCHLTLQRINGGFVRVREILLSESLLLWYRFQTPVMGVRCTFKLFLTKASCLMTRHCHATYRLWWWWCAAWCR